MDAAGNLYGVTGYDGTGNCTLLGGVVGCGTVYELSPPSQPGGAWTETVLYSFQGGNDGYVPTGDLIFDKAGNLYGATLFGGGKGTNCNSLYGGNCGTIFELSPPRTQGGAWTEKVLHSFAGTEPWSIAGDGAEPYGSLVLDGAGNIYGTTGYGGTVAGVCHFRGGCGMAFELDPPDQNGGAWTEKVLHRFLGQPEDGVNPNGKLVLLDGALYGTTTGGGSNQDGVVFELESPPGGDGVWVEDLIHVFADGNDGGNPSSLILGSNGTFYGTAGGPPPYGRGLIFKLGPPGQKGGAWNFAAEYEFTGPPNGSDPDVLSLVPRRSEMYGSTGSGGTGQCIGGGCGTVFGIKQ